MVIAVGTFQDIWYTFSIYKTIAASDYGSIRFIKVFELLAFVRSNIIVFIAIGLIKVAIINMYK